MDEAEARKRAEEIAEENATVDVSMFGYDSPAQTTAIETGADLAGAVGVSEAVKLSGIQIESANKIIQQVAAGTLTRDAGINQLKVFLGLTDEQANMVMGKSVGGIG